MKKQIKILLVLVILQLSTSYAVSSPAPQEIPGFVQQHDDNLLNQREKEQNLLLKNKEPQTEVHIEDLRDKNDSNESDNKNKPVIWINEINVSSTSILSEQEINDVKAKYIHKNINIDDINNLLNDINRIYMKKNYITAKAILPAQTIKGGILNIELVESKIGSIDVKGNKYTRDSYILDKFDEPDTFLNIETLEKDIIEFNNNNDIKLKGKIKAGKSYAKTDILLEAYEPNPFHVVPIFDNTGRETIGILKGGIALAHDSLFGYRDQLTVGTNLAHGTTAAYTSYSFPVGNKGTRLNGLFSYNHIKIIDGEFKSLKVTGNSFVYGLNVSHPFISNKIVKLYGNIGVNFKESETYFDKHLTFDTPVKTLNTGFNVEINDNFGVWHTEHNFINGIDGHANKAFFKYEGSIYRVQKLPKDIIGLFKVGTQLTPHDDLPSLEQFQIGGSTSVRGFSEGLLAGNSGYFGSAEFIVPIPFLPENLCKLPLKKLIKGTFFIDHGAAYPYKSEGRCANQYDYLTSVGMGLRINFSNYVSGVLGWGYGLGRREADQPTARFHFSLQANPLQFLKSDLL